MRHGITDMFSRAILEVGRVYAAAAPQQSIKILQRNTAADQIPVRLIKLLLFTPDNRKQYFAGKAMSYDILVGIWPI